LRQVQKFDKQELLKYIDETISLHKLGKEIKPDLKNEIFIPSKLSDFLNQIQK
jgi:uncharacterized protein YdeI (YjbR/CyaY-like superfamily)